MKKYYVLILMLLPFFGFAQNDVETIKKAIANGQVSVISSYLGEELDLSILDDEDIYSKAESTKKIEAFYRNLSGIKSFGVKHQGVSKLNHQYFIGDMVGANGESYRITFFVKETSGKMRISQLRIEDF